MGLSHADVVGSLLAAPELAEVMSYAPPAPDFPRGAPRAAGRRHRRGAGLAPLDGAQQEAKLRLVADVARTVWKEATV